MSLESAASAGAQSHGADERTDMLRRIVENLSAGTLEDKVVALCWCMKDAVSLEESRLHGIGSLVYHLMVGKTGAVGTLCQQCLQMWIPVAHSGETEGNQGHLNEVCRSESLQPGKETERLDFLEGVSLELNSSDYGEKFKALIQLQKYRVTLEEAQKYKFGRLVQNISKQDRPPSQSVAHELMSAWKAEEGASKKRKLVDSSPHASCRKVPEEAETRFLADA